MCYNTRITRKAEEIEAHYGVSRTEKGLAIGELTYNHANGYNHPNFWVIPQEGPKLITPMKWGMLRPDINADDSNYISLVRKITGQGLNAQSEKLFDPKSYYPKSSLVRRCVVPLDGFYEPHTCSKPKDYKVPFYFSPRDGELLSLAGIYTISKQKLVTFSLLTREAEPGSMYANIHNKKNWQGQNRQVVTLARNQVEQWLSNDLVQADVERLVLNGLEEQALTAQPISKDLFSRNANSDRPDIVDVVHDERITLDYSEYTR
ncbi:MAG: SOS response-associated peptidase family protein [Bacteroidota bacterium]|nr:SOS response-associated peptidase family protein [uncultured Allomuricauda sp.]